MNALPDVLRDFRSSMVGRTTLMHRTGDREFLEAVLQASPLEIIPSADGKISTVYEAGDPNDYSRQTGNFDLHKDGLYLPMIPQFVLLQCEDPGRGDSPTVVVDTRPVVAQIDQRPELRILRELELVYRAKNGDEHPRPLVQGHPLADWGVLNLGARAYVRPVRDLQALGTVPTLREVASAMSEVFRLLDGEVVLRHFWQHGDILLIDNHTFVHGRESNSVDPARRLLRVWLSAGTQDHHAQA